MALVRAISTVADGNMMPRFGEPAAVERNRTVFLARYGIAPRDAVLMAVEYEERIVRVGGASRGQTVACEALMTDEAGVALFLMTADCFPVTLYDAMHEAVALLHCGWQPTGKGLPKKAVAAMVREFGTCATDLRAHIGPGIRAASYRFDREKLGGRGAPGWERHLIPGEDGKVGVDILGYIRAQLLEAGVPEDRIETDGHDTVTSPNYFSHRRAEGTSEAEGRFATVVVLR